MTYKPTLVITGARGQLGTQLKKDFCERFNVFALGKEELDITCIVACDAAFRRFKPDIVINAAAYTNVDKAEEEPSRAMLINGVGPKNLAECSFKHSAFLVQISTDYVFNSALNRPIKPYDEPNPINVYGKTKLAGEEAVRQILGRRAMIVRTSWLYGAAGQNFMVKMLSAMRQKGSLRVVSDQRGAQTSVNSLGNGKLLKSAPYNVGLRVVSDQRGTPTSVYSLSKAIMALIDAGAEGVFNFSDAGETTWYGFARQIQDTAFDLGILTCKIPIASVASSEYNAKAQRPGYSVLDSSAAAKITGIKQLSWQAELEKALKIYMRGFSNAEFGMRNA